MQASVAQQSTQHTLTILKINQGTPSQHMGVPTPRWLHTHKRKQLNWETSDVAQIKIPLVWDTNSFFN